MTFKTLRSDQLNGNGFIYVEANKPDRISIKVFDDRGRRAKTINTTISQGVQQLDLNMTDLQSGNYVLNAFSGGHFLKSFRFIKQ